MGTSPLSDIRFANIFLQSEACLIILSIVSLKEQEFFFEDFEDV